jgi:lipopolysaccharide transport system ATP-binding protein
MGSYTLRTFLTERRSNTLLESLEGICPFEVTMQGIPREEYDWARGACVYLEDSVWQPVEEVQLQPSVVVERRFEHAPEVLGMLDSPSAAEVVR